MVEYGFEIGRQLEWASVAPALTMADEHSREIVIIPECLTRLKHCRCGPKTTMFYYRSFFDLRRKNA